MIPLLVPVAAAAGLGGGYLGFKAADGSKKLALSVVALGIAYAVAKKKGVI